MVHQPSVSLKDNTGSSECGAHTIHNKKNSWNSLLNVVSHVFYLVCIIYFVKLRHQPLQSYSPTNRRIEYLGDSQVGSSHIQGWENFHLRDRE